MNVGAPDDSDLIHTGNVTECIVNLVKWLGPKSMGKRFDIVIARNETEAKAALVTRRGKAFDADSMGDIGTALEQMLNGGES